MVRDYRKLKGAALLAVVAHFAAEKHKGQPRKSDGGPYINHPLDTAAILAKGGEEDEALLAAAVLHDTVEDTHTSLAEIRQLFGDEIARLVDFVSDNKDLSKGTRKRLQIQKAASLFDRRVAALKAADKISNLTSFITVGSPKSWDLQRVQGYFLWCKAVTDRLTPLLPRHLRMQLVQLYSCKVDTKTGNLLLGTPDNVRNKNTVFLLPPPAEQAALLEQYIVEMDRVVE